MDVNSETNLEELLQLAIKAAREGQEDGAKVMFREVYSRNRQNETAMMWLAKLASTEEERKQWLTRIVNLNPDNVAAQKTLKKMQYNKDASNNRILVLFGTVAVVMIIIFIFVLLVILMS